MFKTIHRLFHGLAWLMVVIGGAALTGLVLMMCISITGRTLSSVFHSTFMQTNLNGLSTWAIEAGVGPIFGDYEFVAAGLAFCTFAFLGWCQITGGHATVDIFTAGLSAAKRRFLQMLIEVLFAAALVLIAWQLWDGMDTLIRRGSTTFLLQYPLWWNYAVALVPAVISAVIGVYVALVRVAEVVQGRTLLDVAGADH